MRIDLAVQVFSRTVVAGICTHSTLGLLPQEAVHTTNFIHKIEQVFDCFNSATKTHYKEIRGGLCKNSCHLKFIAESICYINSWKIYIHQM